MAKNKKVIDLFPNGNPRDHGQNHYSETLQQFMAPFEEQFPEHYSMEEVYEFGVNAWNAANMTRIMEENGEEPLAHTAFLNMEPEQSIFKALLNAKKEQFAHLERFIIDCEFIPINATKMDLRVTTTTEEEYLRLLMEEGQNYLDGDDNAKEGYINRTALILIPKQPFLDWINSHGDETVTKIPEPYVYLVHEDVNMDTWDAWMAKMYKEYFEGILFDWYMNESFWPKKRTYVLFQKWFSISFSEMVLDTVPEPIVKESY